MDGSVIEIDDSIITIESDADVEDGEVTEVDAEEVNIAAKSQEPRSPLPLTNNSSARETNKESISNVDEELIFEVHFRNKDESLHKRLLKVLKTEFSTDEFDFKINEDPGCSIIAYKKVPDPLPDDDLFLIDTAPTVKLNAAQVPSYKRCNTDILDEETSARKKLKIEEVNKCFRPKMQSSCFNCGNTDHSVRECTRPRNQARIQRARKRTSFRTDRYHVDTEQRFAHIRPGKISSKTRHAMGYSRGELPFMFYRMRVLGYPPAWLEEAKVQGSGIALFNADGTEVQGPEQEQGEAESFKYDINKIIDFPGFNVQPAAKFYDDYQHYNVPPFQEHQLKANFIKSLGENVTKGYKRKKLKDLPTPHNDSPTVERETNLVEHDMEVDDDEDDADLTEEPMRPPLPAGPIKCAPPPPPTEETSERNESPTLDDLRAQQIQLLQQLESNPSVSTGDLSTVELNVSKTESAVESSAEAGKSKPNIFNGPSIEGTPILKFSVYDKLPEGDSFKVGVSDVINFENLPDSTGKYEQMKGVLKNVRQQMEKLQNDDD